MVKHTLKILQRMLQECCKVFKACQTILGHYELEGLKGSLVSFEYICLNVLSKMENLIAKSICVLLLI